MGIRRLLRLPRRAALDFERGDRADEESSPGAVDVVLPVYGAAEATSRCLASLFRHTDLEQHRLVIVVDGDPDFRRDVALAKAPAKADIELIENRRNLGFVASVNRGMALSQRDVVLLNSDTVVTRGWLQKMQAAAYSDPSIATVTPFSNHATLCSLPRPFEANEIPPGFDIDAMAEIVERVARCDYPRLPTGVGMCLYIKRRALDAVGLFDEEAFGRGYGEETDFCFRTLKAGFVHVLDDATFIFHEGEQSFGGERAARIADAERQLQERHPEYRSTIGAFMQSKELRPQRERVVGELARIRAVGDPAAGSPGLEPRVLHLVHGFPPHGQGGTELYAHWLTQWQRERRPVAVYTRVADPSRQLGNFDDTTEGNLRVRAAVNNFTQRNPWSRNALRNPVLERDFAAFLDDVEPDLVHVHHLSGHCLALMGVAASRGVPIVYQVQDWWPLCARANLLPPNRELCSGPEPGKCAACLPLTGLPPAGLWNRTLYRQRGRRARESLLLADAFVMGSRAIEADYRRAGLLRERDPVAVLPYGVELPENTSPPPDAAPRLPLRFGYVGAVMPHKGVHVAVQAFAGLSPSEARLDVWGNLDAAPDYVRELEALIEGDHVKLRGRFDSASDVYRSLDVLLVPSLGLESYGLAAREAMAHGVPVIVSRRGALQEIFDDGDETFGAFVEPGDVAGWRAKIEELIARPETIAEWSRALPEVAGTSQHALQIEAIYQQVLLRRGPA